MSRRRTTEGQVGQVGQHGGAREGAGRAPDAGVPRKHRVEFRLTEAELAEVTAALGEGDTLSSWFRDAGIERARRPR